jgi:hypothetical protein
MSRQFGNSTRAAKLCGLILYADETTTNTIRGVTYYPIVLALANHSLAHRCTRQGKNVVGYLPVLRCPKTIKSKAVRESFGLMNLRVIHQCWSIVLREVEALKLQGGMYLDVHGDYTLLVPSVLFMVADHPEAQKMCGVPTTWNSTRPCRLCMITKS